jgi:hypothetical protein
MGLSYEQRDDMAATRRELQQELEALQRRIDAARRENAEESPRATSQLAQARKDLQEQDYDAAMALARSASDVERGRIAEAASSDPVITDRLQRLQENLARAAETAAAESGARQRSRQADAGDLLAELGNLRRALDRAREQAMSQNQSGSGDPGANAPDAREGQQGQAGGQQGEQGQGGQGQRGQDGQRGNQQASQQPDQPGQQGGEPGNAPGGRGNLEIGGLGNLQGGGFRPSQDLRLAGGAVVPNGSQRELLRNQTQMSAERLAQLRAQLANGVLSAADRDLLAELEKRLKRGLVDPMSDEYRNMTDVVSQLELAALKAQQLEKGDSKSTHVDEVVDDSRQYRDNVAEYYRRLGGGND